MVGWVFLVCNDANNPAFDVWDKLFDIGLELVSGFGGVGLSMGTADETYSFCELWLASSKWAMMVLMIAGRMRWVTTAFDLAVMPPKSAIEEAAEPVEMDTSSVNNGSGRPIVEQGTEEV